ncbi:SrtB family sortase [Niallia circulans]|uniref:SrtB family sortase n=1 Tax=Niallia circulans TaxID=1397 RepID=A0A553SSK9_NIACI|nr:SrtB family sortase [Niallia circulans]
MNVTTTIQRKKINWIQALILLISLVIFVFSLFKISDIVYSYAKNDEIMRDIQVVYHKEAQANNSASTAPLQSLTDINEDIVGWLTIADTKIDYPILQTKNNDYYLTHNYKNEASKEGSIFMDYRNNPDTTNRQTILYGHEMKNGAMFGELKKFLDVDFFSQHKRFSYQTNADNYEVEIFSVYATTTSFDYLKTEFSSEADYKEYLQTITDKSIYDSNVTISEQDQIITLSTCSNISDPNEGRLVVHGKLQKISS